MLLVRAESRSKPPAILIRLGHLLLAQGACCGCAGLGQCGPSSPTWTELARRASLPGQYNSEMLRRGRLWSFLAILALLSQAVLASAQTPTRAEFLPVTDDPSLPRVLVIGDSISIGYTLPLREALKGVANVHRPPENCAHTWLGLEKIDDWLGDGRWDLVHFNWGLHDLKYVDAEGGRALPPKGKQVSTLEEYEANLDKLVVRLKQTGAKLIWRPTTPVPEGASGRYPSDLPKFNRVAARVIDRHGIEVDDLNACIAAEKIPHIRPDNVHFSREASARLAASSADAIRRALQGD